MKLLDALNLLREVPPDAEPTVIQLACGFTPLHLKTFLAAEVWEVSRRKAEIRSGLYGDLLGSLRAGGESGTDVVICVTEWADFDPRLGLRSLGGWSPVLFPEIIATVNGRMAEFERTIKEISASVLVALSTPTLPLPPISFTPAEQASSLDLDLRACVTSSAARLARLPNVRVLNVNQLACLPEGSTRLDAKSEFLAGFPYSLPHAAAMSEMLARLISDRPAKKGLITDLDDTLWKGLVGEIGVDAVAWTLDGGAQIHGLYQQLLASLAAAGVLLGVASKNDPDVVKAAFARPDLILNKDQLFPVEVSWEPKSHSVARILRAWNISADSVVFVDDSPMELAEVAAAHPGIECLQFPAHDWQAAYHLLEQLRDRFGKPRLFEEDSLRAQSLRQIAGDASPSLPSYECFLEDAKPELAIEYCDSEVDPRALELINKTNQFNLNGERHTHGSLLRTIQTPGGFMMIVSYKDKYGPLGKIAVVCGSRGPDAVHVGTWVMSCRAFSRRIEYQCLQELFERFAADHVMFDFRQTERNAPLRDFLTEMLGAPPFPGCTLARVDFQARNPRSRQTLSETLYA